MKLKKINLTGQDSISFEWRSDNYGRAEFAVCPIFKYGKMVEVHIYPKQQPNAKHYYVWKGNAEGLYFQGYEGLENPKIWITSWCKEHKCHSFTMYVPTDSKFMWINFSLGRLGINFRKTSV